MSSELVKVIVQCGGCNKQTEAKFISIEVVSDGKCWGCEYHPHDIYTCMCEGPKTAIEFQCSECKYYGVVDGIS